MPSKVGVVSSTFSAVGGVVVLVPACLMVSWVELNDLDGTEGY